MDRAAISTKKAPTALVLKSQAIVASVPCSVQTPLASTPKRYWYAMASKHGQHRP
jgi:hypothetical protein